MRAEGALRNCVLGIGLLTIASSCAHRLPAALGAPAPTDPLLALWAPAPRLLVWRETIVLDGVVGFQVDVRQEWSAPREMEGGTVVFDVTETEIVNETPRMRARFEVSYESDGMGYAATQPLGADALLEWQPNKRVLPAAPATGMQWSASHRQGERVVERSCEIQASTLCNGGLVSVCDSVDGEVRNVVREHFCPGEGWSGYEALHVEGGRTERRWSEHLVRR